MLELETQMSKPGFWDDRQTAEEVGRELNELKESLRGLERFTGLLEDVEILLELAEEGPDAQLKQELSETLRQAEILGQELHLETLFSSPYDSNHCIMSIHPGAGGTESQDWAEMLYRMYLRWVESHGYRAETLDYQSGDEAGIKNVTFAISGIRAFGHLKSEAGVHRLVRMSPFDSAGRRHTSFASVDVMPQMPEEEALTVDETELRIDTYRAGGAGGQHLNKTDSAVRITHLPTGTVVQCQSERSQHSNKAAAMKILMARLYEIQRKEQEEKLSNIRGGKDEIAWGSQIRSYVFHPYKIVKDHRTGVEVGDVDSVMNGNIDPFIDGWLQYLAAGK